MNQNGDQYISRNVKVFSKSHIFPHFSLICHQVANKVGKKTMESQFGSFPKSLLTEAFSLSASFSILLHCSSEKMLTPLWFGYRMYLPLKALCDVMFP